MRRNNLFPYASVALFCPLSSHLSASPTSSHSMNRFGDLVHLRLRAQATVSDHGGSLALNETEDDLATTTHDTIRSLHATPSNFFPFTPRELLPRLNDLCLNPGGVPSTGVLDNTT
jgi:hypothetical protein